jgi:hypothetical protein
MLAVEQPRQILESLEFQRVTRGVQEEECRLLAGFAGEANMRFHDEFHALGRQARGKLLPFDHGQYDAEVWHRHLVTIDGIVMRADTPLNPEARIQMTDQLMAIEIEVDPMAAAAPFRAIHQGAIELARLADIADLNGQVKWWQ